MKTHKTLCGLLLMLSFIIMIVGCTDPGDQSLKQTVEGKINILWDFGMGLSPTVNMIDHLKKQYSDAEFHYTNVSRFSYRLTASNWPMHFYDVVENDLPADLIVFEDTLAPYLFRSGYLESLDDYIAADLSIHEHVGFERLDHAREIGKGQIYGIPFGKNVYALYYNQDIFDELNFPYPTDGMTWEEVLELARQMDDHPLTGNRWSFGIYDANLLLSQLHFRHVDPQTGHFNAEHPAFQSLLHLVRDYPEFRDEYMGAGYLAFGQKDLAMVAGRLIGTAESHGITTLPTAQSSTPYGLNWDMVSYPVFVEAPDTGPAPAYYYLGIPKNSHKKREAFQLIAHMLTDEVQLANSRLGLASVLRDPFWIAHFGEGVPIFQGKQLQSYFYHPREGSLDIDFDWQMQRGSYGLLLEEKGWMKDYLDYRIEKLEKVGVVSEVFGDEAL